jgi:hypothetical protein
MDGSLIARNANRKPAHHVDLNERTVKNAAPLSCSTLAGIHSTL